MLRMLGFAVVVPLVWCLVHVYLGRRLFERGLWSGWARRLGLGVFWFLAVLVLLTSVSGRLGLVSGVLWDVMSWVTYVYMGFLSLLIVLLLMSEVVRMLRKKETPRGDKPERGRRQFLRSLNFGILSSAGVLTAYGAHNALRKLVVEDVNVKIKGLPKAFEGLKIVQISDLHVGPTIRRPFVEKVVNVVNALNADVIVITGDIADGYVETLKEDIAPLQGLRAPEGIYYVTGNHEYYWGAEPWIREMRRLGIKPLVNAHEVIRRRGAELVMAGVTDLSAGRFVTEQASDPKKAIEGAPVDAIKILLAHQPKSVEGALEAGYHLQLSGHTHGGQFVPWSFIVWLVQPFVAGLHNLGTMQLYVNRGTGYWGPPIRVGSDPEVTKLTLFKEHRS